MTPMISTTLCSYKHFNMDIVITIIDHRDVESIRCIFEMLVLNQFGDVGGGGIEEKTSHGSGVLCRLTNDGNVAGAQMA